MAEKFIVKYNDNSITVSRNTGNPLLSSAVSFFCFDGREKIHLQRLREDIEFQGIKSVDDIYSIARNYKVTVVPAKPLHKRYNSARIGF